MNKLKYFLQYLCIMLLFLIYKILGLRYSSNLSGIIFTSIGPLFRSSELCRSNISRAFPGLSFKEKNKQTS